MGRHCAPTPLIPSPGLNSVEGEEVFLMAGGSSAAPCHQKDKACGSGVREG